MVKKILLNSWKKKFWIGKVAQTKKTAGFKIFSKSWEFLTRKFIVRQQSVFWTNINVVVLDSASLEVDSPLRVGDDDNAASSSLKDVATMARPLFPPQSNTSKNRISSAVPAPETMHLSDDDDSKLENDNKQLRQTKIWIPRNFHITCCLGGTPMVTKAAVSAYDFYNFIYIVQLYFFCVFKIVYNFTYKIYNYLIEEEHTPAVANPSIVDSGTYNCRIFHGAYSLSKHDAFNPLVSMHVQVVCNCPGMRVIRLTNESFHFHSTPQFLDIGQHALDENCRRLSACKNNGFRSLTDPKKCLCVQPFFGDKCEKFCDQGQRMRGKNECKLEKKFRKSQNLRHVFLKMRH